MKYAKLVNNYPVYAPNPITVDDVRIGNPPSEILLSQGFKPVIFYDEPEPLGIGWWEEVWTEDNLNIYNSWTWHEAMDEDEISDTDALNILIGEEME